MKKAFLLFALVVFKFAAFAQQTTHDLATFTAPAGWKKQEQGTVLGYIATDEKKGRLCVLNIFKSTDGSGDANTDFIREWKEKVLSKFPVTANPASEPADPKPGWESRMAADTFIQDGRKLMVLLTTLTGYHKTVSLLAITNDKTYITDLQAFYKTLSLSKPGNEAAQQPSTNEAVSTTTGVQTSAGNLTYTPPAEWTENPLKGSIRSFSSPLLECTDQSYYTLFALGTTAFTGDLQEYAKMIHKIYFYQADPILQYPEAGRRVVKGIDESGREFLSYEAPSVVFKSDNSWHWGMVYLVRTGGVVASFMLELRPQNREKFSPPSYFTLYFLYDCKQLQSVWNRFITTIKLANQQKKETYNPEDLVGNWECRVTLGATIWGFYSSMPIQKYHFADDGRWQSERMITENNFGKYGINGNQLSIVDGAGKKISYKFKLEKTFEYNTWHRYLTLYDTNGAETKLNYTGE